MTSTHAPSDRPGDPAGRVPTPSTPVWLGDVLEVIEQRQRLVVATAAAISLLGVAAAFLLPQLVPPTPLAGGAVGLAAALLSVAIALAVDAVDLTVRGARHVRAAGGAYLGTLAGEPDPGAADPLAAELEVRLWEQGHLRVAFAGVSRHLRATADWAEATAVALAERGHRVLLADLTAEDPWSDGVADVVRDAQPLSSVVTFDDRLPLARIGAGADGAAALSAFPALASRLPRDVEIVVVVTPPIMHPGVLAATEVVDRLLLLARRDRTPRVDMIAGLDAVGDSPASAEVVLLAGSRPDVAAVTASADQTAREPAADETAETAATHLPPGSADDAPGRETDGTGGATHLPPDPAEAAPEHQHDDPATAPRDPAAPEHQHDDAATAPRDPAAPAADLTTAPVSSPAAADDDQPTAPLPTSHRPVHAPPPHGASSVTDLPSRDAGRTAPRSVGPVRPPPDPAASMRPQPPTRLQPSSVPLRDDTEVRVTAALHSLEAQRFDYSS